MEASILERLRHLVFGLSSEEASFARRGFHCSDHAVQDGLESIGRTFISGYNQAIGARELGALAQRLDQVQIELRGFAYEGAAMGLALLDHITPWNTSRVQRFIAGPAAHHVYMVHVGIGWAIGRLPWLRLGLNKFLSNLDPLLRWLAIDGYGFHEGYFNARRQLRNRSYPAMLSQNARRVFDQGLGRSLWFVEAGDVDRIRKTINAFPTSRQVDLWAGIGLASAYAGSVSRVTLESLMQASGAFRPQLAQGAAFAAKTRQFAGNPARHTDLACRIFCGLTADECASVTDAALMDLPRNGQKVPAYEIWRKRIQSHFPPR